MEEIQQKMFKLRGENVLFILIMNLLFVSMIFKKLKINRVNFLNRIIVSPMCQYSANNGCPTKWHYKHPNVRHVLAVFRAPSLSRFGMG